MTKQIQVGDIAKCRVTGFEGVVIGRHEYLSNCPRLTIQPRAVKDGKPIDCRSFDDVGLVFVSTSDHQVIPVERPANPVGLGDLVEDKLTSLVGVATVWTVWSNGCSRFTVQPKELKDGLPVDASSSDEKDLVILESASPKPKPVKTGGPRPEPRRP